MATAIAIVVALALIAVSCGDDDGEDDGASTVPTAAPATPTPSADGGSDDDSQPSPTDVVKQLQQDLTDLGDYSGPISGDYDSATEEAVRAFQEFAGIPVDGIVGPRTAGAIDVAVGRSGGGSAQLQTALATLCYYTGPIDGVYGPQTEAALRAFQADVGLAQDGLYGPETADALVQAWPSRPETCPQPPSGDTGGTDTGGSTDDGTADAADSDTGSDTDGSDPGGAATLTATIDGQLLTLGNEVSCTLGPDDGGFVTGTTDDGTTLTATIDGTASRVVIDGPSGSYDAAFTFVGNDDTTLTIEAEPPAITVQVPLDICTAV